MPKLIRLTDAQVRKLREPGRHAVDSTAGLYLNIPEVGQSTFVCRTTIGGKRVLRSLGAADRMTLAEARQRASQAAQAMQAEADAPEPLPTFAQALAAYIDRRGSGWREGGKSENQWRTSMATYVLPSIGHKPIDSILPADIVTLLAPIWAAKPETARRVRQRISAVLTAEFRMRQMMRADPADEALIKDLMPRLRVEVKHHAAPTIAQLQSAFEWLDDRYASHQCLRFVALHACRSGEARNATWGEVHTVDGHKTLILPASKMKAGKAWRMPIVWLPEKPKDAKPDDLIFPGAKGKPLSDMTLIMPIKKRKLPWTVHGIRAAFRTWASTAGAQTEVSEMALAHTPDKLTAAYQRGDLLAERRLLAEKWAAVLWNRNLDI